ncbi:MAG: lysophospholipid acyltransferase family protein [Planctomycetota bacterium]
MPNSITNVIRWSVDGASYVVVRGIVAVVQVMPLDMGDHFSRLLATLLTGPLPIRRAAIQTNLDRVMPTLSLAQRHRLVWSMWHHLMLMVCEIAWAQRRLHRANWKYHFRYKNNRESLAHLLSGRPMVMVTGHFGNFEVGGYMNGLMGVRSTTIARQLDNRFLHDWIECFRSSKGQDMVDKVGCAPIVDRHLRDNGVLTLLADQHAGDKGTWVDFCGVPASCHKALALFALTSDAPMLAVYTRRIDHRPMQFEIGMTASVDPLGDHGGACDGVASLTDWYNRELESMIQLAPEQYWWLHRRWRRPPTKVAKRLAKKRERANATASHVAKASDSLRSERPDPSLCSAPSSSAPSKSCRGAGLRSPRRPDAA